MKLYYSPGACSLATHIALREAGIPFDLEKVDLRTKTTASGADYRSVSAKGYVPTLVLDDGQVLTVFRVVLANPLTTPKILADILEEQRGHAERLLASGEYVLPAA